MSLCHLFYFYRGQIYKVEKIDALKLPALYHLVDLLNDKVDGAYYAEQLKPAPNPKKSDYWQIEKVIKTKVENGQKLSFVKFLFYPGFLNKNCYYLL